MGTCILTGNEPFLIEKKIKDTAAKVAGQNELCVFNTDCATDAINEVNTVSFFSESKLVIARVESLKEFDLKEFYAFYNSARKDCNLLIVVPSIDSKLKIYKEVSKSVVEYNKFTDKNSLKNFCLEYLGGIQFGPGAFDEFEQRLQYLNMDEVTLFNVTNELTKLILLEKDVITVEDVEHYIEPNLYFDAFSLVNYIKKADATKALKQVDAMISIGCNNTIGLLSLLSRNYRLIYKADLIKKGEPSISQKALMERVGAKYLDIFIDAKRALKSLNVINDTIERLKNSLYTDEEAIKITVLKLVSIAKEK